MKKKWIKGLVASLCMQTMFMGNSVQAAEGTSNTCYEIFVYSFNDSNGDGIGDLNGVSHKLDYINDGDESTQEDLGCDMIWLMPVMPSTTYHKYDVMDYMDIDPEYGTLDDFKSLVSKCHERGIQVIIDLPMNHSSSKHPWFLKASEYLQSLPEGQEPDSEKCPYVDYYNFSRENQAGYNQLEGTSWFYESRFWSEMPDLNLGNPLVRQEFEKIVQFWQELGVDGFRLDAAKEYYSDMTDKNVEVLTWFNQMVKTNKPDAYIVAEVWSDMDTYGKYYASGIDSCFDFAFAGNEGIIADTVKKMSSYNASSYGKALITLQNTLEKYGEDPVDAPFYTNHDMARGAGYYSGEDSESQTKIAQAMNLTMTGQAFLYYGEELGMKGAGKDENFRAPMYWSTDKNAEGMCNGPEAMDTVKMKYGSLEEQEKDEASVYQYVKDVLHLREKYPEIQMGKVTFEEDLSGDNICTIRKSLDDSEILLVYNISGEQEAVDLTGVSLNQKTQGNISLEDILVGKEVAPTLKEGILQMPAYSIAVLR